jgi:hypothetical protein
MNICNKEKHIINMNIKEKEKTFKKCVEDILIFCLTHPIEYKWDSLDDSSIKHDSINDLINLYVYRFMDVFNKHETNLLDNNLNEFEWQEIIDEFLNCIGLTSAMQSDNADGLYETIRICVSDIRKLYPKHEYIEECVGTCCFCKGECNPMSQSCGSCARGLSGAVLGIPVPEDLKQYM